MTLQVTPIQNCTPGRKLQVQHGEEGGEVSWVKVQVVPLMCMT